MLIQKIELQNFGAFLGKHEIDLSLNGGKKPVILFGGLNGSGKTTFLESMQNNIPSVIFVNGTSYLFRKNFLSRKHLRINNFIKIFIS